VTKPRDLTDLIPNQIRADLAVVAVVLEQHGSAVTKALRQLDQATAAPADAAAGRAGRGRVAACRTRDRHRPWLGCGLSAGVDP
jgi:hypothetical protein